MNCKAKIATGLNNLAEIRVAWRDADCLRQVQGSAVQDKLCKDVMARTIRQFVLWEVLPHNIEEIWEDSSSCICSSSAHSQ